MSENYPDGPTQGQAWGLPERPMPSTNVQSTMNQMTDQLQTVIDAAERAAEAIRHDAEDQARRHLIDAQRRADQLTAERVGLISELTDDLIQHADTVRQHSEQMVRALESAIDSVTSKLDQPSFREPLGAPPPPREMPGQEPLATAPDQSHQPPAPSPGEAEPPSYEASAYGGPGYTPPSYTPPSYEPPSAAPPSYEPPTAPPAYEPPPPPPAVEPAPFAPPSGPPLGAPPPSGEAVAPESAGPPTMPPPPPEDKGDDDDPPRRNVFRPARFR